MLSAKQKKKKEKMRIVIYVRVHYINVVTETYLCKICSLYMFKMYLKLSFDFLLPSLAPTYRFSAIIIFLDIYRVFSCKPNRFFFSLYIQYLGENFYYY